MAPKSDVPRRIGLARMLSKLGYCSRSKAFLLIRAGRVKVNGSVRHDPESPVQPQDRIEVDGDSIAQASKLYLMMNKPRGLVTTAADEKGRPTVYTLLPPELPWVAPIGRLDQASEGLLLFTNDSEWGAHISSPESHIAKTYHVQIGALAEESLLVKLRSGVVDGGELLRVENATLLRHGKRNSWLEIVLDEGKNRHIRRMFAVLDIEVLRLVRVAIGSVSLGNLGKGKVRPLTTEEKQQLSKRSR
jgi:23S rRNA pseudouridine2605 synthase